MYGTRLWTEAVLIQWPLTVAKYLLWHLASQLRCSYRVHPVILISPILQASIYASLDLCKSVETWVDLCKSLSTQMSTCAESIWSYASPSPFTLLNISAQPSRTLKTQCLDFLMFRMCFRDWCLLSSVRVRCLSLLRSTFCLLNDGCSFLRIS